MRVAIGQINSTIGDFEGNVGQIVEWSERAASQGANIVVFPELALCGYPPMDLLEQPAFLRANSEALEGLKGALPASIAVVLGYVSGGDVRAGSEAGSGHQNTNDRQKALPHADARASTIQNSAVVLRAGEVVHSQAKTLLPTYDVFDEARYFTSAEERRLWNYAGADRGAEASAVTAKGAGADAGLRIGIAICEDMWWEQELHRFQSERDPVRELAEMGADLLLVPSASPFYAGKLGIRRGLALSICEQWRIPLVYANAVGANDSLIFDGRSFALSAQGECIALAEGFREDLLIVDVDVEADGGLGRRTDRSGDWAGSGVRAGVGGSASANTSTELQSGIELRSSEARERYAEVGDALRLGIRDYVRKTGFERVHLGLSGGVDSALVLVLAVQALGADRVSPFMLPSQYSSEGSISDSEELCARLGIRAQCIPIEGIKQSFASALNNGLDSALSSTAGAFSDGAFFGGGAPDLAEENIQARIRANLLMTWSNKCNSLLLTTGNKSELGVGYCTLYGDMAGALAVIGDLFKTEVYGLCEYINTNEEIIPRSILTKAPSAELRPNQKDADSLPPYEVLDRILEAYLMQGAVRLPNVDPKLMERVLGLVLQAEYKRYQAPPVLKVSPKTFGMGRRIPIARLPHELKFL